METKPEDFLIFLEKSIKLAELAKKHIPPRRENLVALSSLNYLIGYLHGGIETIRWQVEVDESPKGE